MAGENINRRLNIYINDREVINSLSGVNKELTKTRNQMRNLNRGAADYDEQLRALQNTYSELQARQSDFNDELQLTNKDLGAARENFTNLLSGIASGDMQAVQAGLLGIRGSIVASTQAAWAFVATPVGAFIAGLIGIGVATKAWASYNDEAAKTNKIVSSITKLSGDSLDAVRVRTKAMAETFDQDFNSILETARALVNEFDISYVEALDRIENGLIKGGAANGEFLDSMKEYPVFFAAAGYSIEEFQNLVNTGIDLGIYSDKLPDAIKEFGLSITEETQAAQDALTNAFGPEFTGKLFKGIKDGSVSVKEALFLISTEAKNIGLNSQQAQLLTADLFKGAGEDAGGALKIFEAVRESIKNQIEPLNEVEQAAQDLIDSEKELAQAQEDVLKSDGYAKWKNNAMIALNTVIEGFWTLTKAIFNSREELLKAANQKSVDLNTADQVKNFEQYVESRKKSMGSLYDFEKVREERIAAIRKSLSAAGAGSWDASPAQEAQQQRLEAELQAIKNYQVKELVVRNNHGLKVDDGSAKARAKALSEAEKHAKEVLKIEQDLQKELLATKRNAQDLNLGLIADDYDREKAVVNVEYDRKIEDLKANIKKEQDAIAGLQTAVGSKKTASSDLPTLKKQLEERQGIVAASNDTLIALEETRELKIAAIQEKYLKVDFDKKQAAIARDLQLLETKQNNELASITDLATAKAILGQYLDADELSKVRDLETAKKKIKEQFQKEQIQLQIQHLTDLSIVMKAMLENTTLPPEQREAVLKFYDDLALKLSALKVAQSSEGDTNTDTSSDIKSLSGLDILGFTPEQWETTFESLDTFSEKIAAVELVVGAVQNAFGKYFQFLEAGEKRSLQKFEAANRQKQNDLTDQLDKGYITQEIYTARKAKLDNDLAKKKAELEYKQAKREKIMAVASILMNTAIGVSKALAQGGFILGVPWAGVVATLGAIELGLALAQPLPSKDGFYDGGYTGSGPERNSPGPVHYDEYVVPKKVLFSNDPVVPNIVGYLEAKRTGKQPAVNQQEETSNATASSTASTQDANGAGAVINRLTAVLERLESNGLIAYLENDIKTAKKIRDKIKELTKIESNSKI
ncbi:phage tail tape measure protein [Flavobacterium sp. 14A]|uniref:phage tail tape measure protein n=1 Tax=Flavobacterium sp. 14A TaxID=2735896 RepID=UPI0015706B6E|nr:phage tail tape measure protein [Flavobacterium sp. 14A]NRT11545.1 hypothetical protein [Flavobacterium sp. 14A]